MRRGLLPTREQARQAINAGVVTVNGAPADKPARLVQPGDALLVVKPPKYVGRGGDKLEGALTAFGIDVDGAVCLDIGSSTGGFTDCLLQRGAASVLAVDVGRAQLHERLVADTRVIVREQTDIRDVHPSDFARENAAPERENAGSERENAAPTGADGQSADVIVCDVSFIGLAMVLPKMLELLAADGLAVVLVKPQFEAGRQEASRGKGVIRDPEIWHRVLLEVVETATQMGARVSSGVVSPLKGGSGNVEFFLAITHAEAETPDGLGGVRVDQRDPTTAVKTLVAVASDLR